MIKTKETNKNENNIVEEYSKEYVLDKIKEYLGKSPEYYDKSYFFSKKINEIIKLLEMYGEDNFEQIAKKIELDYFFKNNPNKRFLKDYYMKYYSETPFKYDKYHYMIKEINKLPITKYKQEDSRTMFEIAYIKWLFYNYPKIEITLPEDYDEDLIFELVSNVLKDMGVYDLLSAHKLDEFKEDIYINTYKVIEKKDIMNSIYKIFIQDRIHWINVKK